jgi:YbbR domain-containing protein
VDEQGDPVKGVTVSPDVITAQVPIEQQVSYKTLPVVPKLVGSPAMGYQLSGFMVDPTVVTVVGEAGTLKDVTNIQTLAVNVSGATNDLTVNTGLDLPSGVSLVRKQNVTVRAYVQAAEGSTTISVAPTITGLSDKLTASTQPGTVQVTVAGPIPILNTLKVEDVKVTLDGSGLRSGGSTALTPNVTVPSAIRVLQVVPEQVNVAVK